MLLTNKSLIAQEQSLLSFVRIRTIKPVKLYILSDIIETILKFRTGVQSFKFDVFQFRRLFWGCMLFDFRRIWIDTTDIKLCKHVTLAS